MTTGSRKLLPRGSIQGVPGIEYVFRCISSAETFLDPRSFALIRQIIFTVLEDINIAHRVERLD